ncbi:helix-turn-helix transcriptional regulator [Martelella lutilitoris]|uniref:Helix-turn-helix transcriptional regulator n=1 Tax=Martelella lutilitoris TaxID=2583532 RepID=A0A5C4JTD1_9HYPH|nr:helix-turn-helix domain-containing protein [Martelella lutilitoris]TNB48480.1 helix-turn-helix transcriptional regulator [Martelella lutilitoris]
MIDQFKIIADTALPVVALYSAFLAFGQTRFHASARLLGCLFVLLFIISPLPLRFDETTLAGHVYSSLVWGLFAPASTLLAPLFYFYVLALTREPDAPHDRPSGRHFILPALAAVAGIAMALLPVAVRNGLFSAAETGMPLPVALSVLLGIWRLLGPVTFMLWLVYVVLMYRRLTAYRKRLCDLHASTERLELYWINWLMGIVALYALLNLIDAALFDPLGWAVVPVVVDRLWSVLIVMVLGVWGLRQRPGLLPPDEAPTQTVESGKYEKSALSRAMQQRIADKLVAAMREERLYRDANLSLWSLSQHIGVAPNYISQTLSETLGQSFYAFVNGFRIGEAKNLLSSETRSVLEVAYDVGFNSKSAFYTSFRRVTGKTPAAFRKAQEADDTARDNPKGIPG